MRFVGVYAGDRDVREKNATGRKEGRRKGCILVALVFRLALVHFFFPHQTSPRKPLKRERKGKVREGKGKGRAGKGRGGEGRAPFQRPTVTCHVTQQRARRGHLSTACRQGG